MKNENGQAMVEYVVMLGLFLGIIAILMLFLGAFTEYGWRLYTLVGLDYP